VPVGLFTTMLKFFYALLALLWMGSTFTVALAVSADPAIAVQAKINEPDSRKMESDLQHLPWKQFRLVILSIPKLKAGIDVYGPTGWQFVQQNYSTYGWKAQIDKLDGVQKKRLADLIQTAKGTR
jgi:hypothetical protein